MSIDKITSKILSDAEAYRKELLDDANSKSEEILGHARIEADAMIKESRAKGEEEKAKTVSRKKSVADNHRKSFCQKSITRKQGNIGTEFDMTCWLPAAKIVIIHFRKIIMN